MDCAGEAMKKLVLILFLIPTLLFAQAIPTSKLIWDQDAPSLTDAQSYTYKYYADGSTTGVAFTGVTCTGTVSPFTCTVNFPAFTPGNNSITLTSSNIAGESAKSAPLDFTFIVTPSSPRNIRIGG